MPRTRNPQSLPNPNLEVATVLIPELRVIRQLPVIVGASVAATTPAVRLQRELCNRAALGRFSASLYREILAGEHLRG